MAIINGWGRGTWGELAWGTALPVNIATAGVTTSALGTPIPTAGADVLVTTLAITSANGAATVVAEANVTPASLAITSAQGDIQLVTNNFLSVAGYTVTSQLGTVTPTAAADVTVVGLAAMTIDLGVPLVYGEIDTDQDPNYNVISDSQTPVWEAIATR
tara:strand:+ start:434 stop:910 length:477 start_codon:yes stop_codon:yes gene_type:complete